MFQRVEDGSFKTSIMLWFFGGKFVVIERIIMKNISLFWTIFYETICATRP